jgi:hypothetical protein
LSQTPEYDDFMNTNTTGIFKVVARTLIIRIYRSRRNQPDHLLGVVEEVGKTDQIPFKSMTDLWDIVSRPSRKKMRKTTSGDPTDPPNQTQGGVQ